MAQGAGEPLLARRRTGANDDRDHAVASDRSGLGMIPAVLGTPDSADALGRSRRPRGGRLFRKYLWLFVGIVGIALLVNTLVEILFSYQDHKDGLIRIQREQARAAAIKI